MTSLADTHTAQQTSDGVDGSGVGPEDPELALAASAGNLGEGPRQRVG